MLGRVGDQRCAVKGEPAAVRYVQPGHAVEEGGLAGAVGTDQAVDFTMANGQRHVAQRLDAAEVFGDRLRFEKRCWQIRAHARPSARFSPSSRLRSGDGHRPAGLKRMTRTSARPKTSMRRLSGSTIILPKSAIWIGPTP
ncbi:hypothetical protein SDC9_140509 [bioreactor metagenome]|uniref:Uncharacterized protein n=1 Tax=bioreactor metagenome TaxID=1076179 RepID=A0A645DYF9_9ZZZZ